MWKGTLGRVGSKRLNLENTVYRYGSTKISLIFQKKWKKLMNETRGEAAAPLILEIYVRNFKIG